MILYYDMYYHRQAICGGGGGSWAVRGEASRALPPPVDRTLGVDIPIPIRHYLVYQADFGLRGEMLYCRKHTSYYTIGLDY